MNLSQMPTVKMQVHDSRIEAFSDHLLYRVLRQEGSALSYSFTYIGSIWTENLPRYLSLETGSPNLTIAKYFF